MSLKISPASVKDFEFFLSTHLDIIGEAVGGQEHESSGEGHSALECWWSKDTHGKELHCREPNKLSKAVRSKASWNLQIKLWAEDIADGMLLRQSELVDYCHGLPGWIFEATMRQAGKIVMERVGFVPRFARLERVHGQWWAPEMDWFDPGI